MEGIKEILLSVDADRGYQNNTCSHIDVVVCKADSRARSRAMRRQRPKYLVVLEQQEETGCIGSFLFLYVLHSALDELEREPKNNII
jgi:hypothetical protein